MSRSVTLVIDPVAAGGAVSAAICVQCNQRAWRQVENMADEEEVPE